VEGLFNAIAPQVRKLDLSKTSKRAAQELIFELQERERLIKASGGLQEGTRKSPTCAHHAFISAR
jgi:hypothetical protein